MSEPNPKSRRNIWVLSGPTAVGKGTVVARLKQVHPELFVSCSATTRAPRPGEVHGIDYWFITDAEFDALIARGELLEWAEVHGKTRYGTPRKPVLQAAAEHRTVLMEIDMQGAAQVRHTMPEAKWIFLAPPSWDELVRRLLKRGTESAEQRTLRLATAKRELARQSEFDYVIVNNQVDQAVADLVALLGL